MPTLTDLPPELLLSVLLEPQLDYKDLKCISRVCKTLHGIEQDSKLDTKLFRKRLPSRQGDEDSKEVVKVKAGAIVKLHPMPEYVELMPFSINDLQPMFGEGRYEPSESSKMIDFPCMNEYATSPPSRRIVWKGLDPKTILETTSKNGVTVKQVLVDHVKYWNEPIEGTDREDYIDRLREVLDEMEGGEGEEGEATIEQHWFTEPVKEILSSVEHGQPLSRRHANPSPTFISGIYQVKALGDDSVEFTARWEGAY
ncbi:hypothetical protein JCM5350_000018 [Sporobolomyces pararoseus]